MNQHRAHTRGTLLHLPLVQRFAALVMVCALWCCSSSSDQLLGHELAPEPPVLAGIDAGTPALDASSCTPQLVPGVEAPGLAMYILLDRSYAMRDPQLQLQLDKWRPVRDALVSYVQNYPKDDLAVGLAYFPADGHDNCGFNNMPRCICRDSRMLCTASLYDPDVVLKPLSAMQRIDIANSLEANEANNCGPLTPAFQQSEIYLKEWRKANPHKKAIRVLIGAGVPFDSCAVDGSTADLNNLANNSDFRTYVVAVTNDPRGLDRLAGAGGTDHSRAFDFTTTPLDNMNEVMGKISAAETNCDFDVPAGAAPKSVRPELTVHGTSITVPLKQVDNRQQCGKTSQGWYQSGERMSLCDDVCAQVNNGSGQFDASVVTVCPADTPTR